MECWLSCFNKVWECLLIRMTKIIFAGYWDNFGWWIKILCILFLYLEEKAGQHTTMVVEQAPTKVIEVASPGQAPKFMRPIQPCIVVEGQTCTFSAVVSGDPQPEFTWLKEKVDLKMTESHSTTFDPATKTCSLIIVKCQQADTGVYSCKASNTAGSATCTANVVVTRKYITETGFQSSWWSAILHWKRGWLQMR